MKIHADGTTDVFRPGANLAKPCLGDKLTTKRVKEDCGAERRHLYDGTVWRRRGQ